MDSFQRGDLVFDASAAGPADSELIVALHGFPQNRHVWDRITPQLNAAGYRTLAPDQRGYSPRARPTGRRAYAQSELVADVLALIDASSPTKATKVHLVGHDWGAFVAWAFASRHPERLRTLTAVSVPHPRALGWAMPRGQLLKSWYMVAFQVPKLPEAFLTTPRGVALMQGGGLSAAQVHSYLDPLGPRRPARGTELVSRAAVLTTREGLRAPVHGAHDLRLERPRRRHHSSRRRGDRSIRHRTVPVRGADRNQPLDPRPGSGSARRTHSRSRPGLTTPTRGAGTNRDHAQRRDNRPHSV
jgi:pimeloyl-ACP methyl ester carboxylesterase